MTRSLAPDAPEPLYFSFSPISHVYLAGQQRNHSCFMHSPWRGMALITYPSKGTKWHREITLKCLTPDKTIDKTHEMEGEWELGPVPTLSYIQDGGLVDASSQCKASFGYCICNKSLFILLSSSPNSAFLLDGWFHLLRSKGLWNNRSHWHCYKLQLWCKNL